MLKDKGKFIKALNTLFFAWGGDTPEEVYWGANELLDWYESEFNTKLGIRFDYENLNFDDVINIIKDDS